MDSLFRQLKEAMILPRLSPKAIQTLRTFAKYGTLYRRYPGTGHYPKWFVNRHGGKPVVGIFDLTIDKMEDLGLLQGEKIAEKSDLEMFGVHKEWITVNGREALELLDKQGGGASKAGPKRFNVEVTMKGATRYIKTVKRGWGARGIVFTHERSEAKTFNQSQAEQHVELAKEARGVMDAKAIPV